MFVNERLIDLEYEAITDYRTRIGCEDKSDQICKAKKDMCSNYEQVWGSLIKCDKKVDDTSAQVFGLNETSYLALKDIQVNNRNGFKTELFLKLSREENFMASKTMVLAYLEVYSESNGKLVDSFYLNYNLRLNRIEFVKNNDEGVVLFGLTVDLNDGFWSKLRLEFVNGRFYVSVNDRLRASSEFEYSEDGVLKSWLGGCPKLKAAGISGCIQKLTKDLLVLRESVNVAKGCLVDSQKRGNY